MTRTRAKELLPIIEAYANGADVEYRIHGDTGDTGDPWHLTSAPDWALGFDYRIAPKPVTRAWSKPEDVPGPVCWLRLPGGDVMVIGFDSRGIQYAGLDMIATWLWSQIDTVRYSTDRVTWHPCTVTEDAR